MRLTAHNLVAASRRSGGRAFTLVEMLIVLVIIGVLAALALPAIRGNLESRAIDAASRQLLEDLSFARQRAIAHRSVVAVVFLNTNIFDPSEVPPGYATLEESKEIKRLEAGIFTHYALYQFRRVGEQPGFGTAGYITEWKSLPEKTFLSTNSDIVSSNWSVLNLPKSGLARFPFPFSDSAADNTPIQVSFNYIAFDPSGRPVEVARFGLFNVADLRPKGDVDIAVARGAVFYARDNNGALINFELQEIPLGNAVMNRIHLDGVTGRGQWIKAEVK